ERTVGKGRISLEPLIFSGAESDGSVLRGFADDCPLHHPVWLSREVYATSQKSSGFPPLSVLVALPETPSLQRRPGGTRLQLNGYNLDDADKGNHVASCGQAGAFWSPGAAIEELDTERPFEAPGHDWKSPAGWC